MELSQKRSRDSDAPGDTNSNKRDRPGEMYLDNHSKSSNFDETPTHMGANGGGGSSSVEALVGPTVGRGLI